jgi:methyltransferase (TIGR00027 family)
MTRNGRTDDDTWDLASSVGATATLVAAARAVASRGDDAVIDDPFAEPLVRAVGVDFFTRFANGELPPERLAIGDSPDGMRRLVDGMAARTRFFDDFLSAATHGDGGPGVRQVVILASGLDARAHRLDWPAATVLFEIDQPEVLAFKSRALADLGAHPRVDLRRVTVDLRDDWPAALRAAGFDPAAPTAWIAEGLLGYLPPDAQDRLLDLVGGLSAPGSRFAVEGVPSHAEDDEEVRERMKASAQQWSGHGYDIDFSDLVYLGERADVAEYLTQRGWTTTSAGANDLLVRYGLAPVHPEEGFSQITYVEAVR